MMRTLPAGPYTLRCAVEGEGRPALVIGSALYYPRTFSAALRRHLRLAFLDHRGFALPTRATTPHERSLEAVIADTEHARAALGLDRFVLIGHSGHAFMALDYARRFPERVSHLVLIASGPSNSAAMRELAERHWEEAVCPARKARFAADIAHLAETLAASPRERHFVAFCLAFGARSWFDPDYDATALWEGVVNDMEVIDHLWGETFRDFDVSATAAALTMPVLLALGRFDFLVAPHFAWEPYRAAFRDLTVRVFDRSGHTPQLEEADLFDAELLGWIARTDRHRAA